MNTVTVELPRELHEVKIETFADVHIGEKECDIQLLHKRIKMVQDDPTMYCILNGDLIDNATVDSVGDTYAATCTPMEQMKSCVGLFEPIKDKIISIAGGNHESRSYKKSGVDLSWFIANEFGIEKRYMNIGGLIYLVLGAESRGRKDAKGNVRQLTYTLYHTHGRGGGRRAGAKAIRLEDMAAIIDADIYIHSHTHLPMTMKNAYFRVNQTQRTVEKVDKLFVNTGAFLDYGGYGQVYEYRPSSKANPTIILNGRKKEFKAIL